MYVYVFSELVPGQRLAKCLLKCGHLARLIAVFLCLVINYALYRVYLSWVPSFVIIE